MIAGEFTLEKNKPEDGAKKKNKTFFQLRK
jgi:hypothetical protein